MKKNIKILIDEPTLSPSEEFLQMAETISGIIINSDPKFTLGIYGEWGTGKSTLMKCIQSELKNEKEGKILPVWFNAWRFEREENFATIALMKTIAYEMAKNEKFASLSQSILRGMKLLGKDLFRKAALETMMTEKGIEEMEEKLTAKMEFLDKIDKDTIYFDGIETISKEFKKIRKLKKDKDYRVVVFIDDLDRCSPKKALEVLESIKVFLDIEGFVYIIGISVETMNRLISEAYKETGINGREYIKKIIQIPIKIPKWKNSNIVQLIENNVADNLETNYKKFVLSNSNRIAQAVNYNPRQIKRFINNIIIAVETFAKDTKKQSMSLNEVFFVQVMTYRFTSYMRHFKEPSTFKNAYEEGFEMLSKAMYQNMRERKMKKEGRRVFVGGMHKPQRELEEKWIQLLTSSELNPTKIKDISQTILQMFTNKDQKSITFGKYKRVADRLSLLTQEDWELLSEFRNYFSNKINWSEFEKIIELLDESPYQSILEDHSTEPKEKSSN